MLDRSLLDDPAILDRHKYCVVLNNLCPDDPLYFVMATSNIERFKKAAHLAGEIVMLDHARYGFLNRPTALDFTDVKAMPLPQVVALHGKGLATVVGQLEVDDLATCDEVIRRSRFIQPRILPLILPGKW
jgi:hypothetical protein